MKHYLQHFASKWEGDGRSMKNLFALITIVVLSACGRGNYNGTYQGTVAPSSTDSQGQAANGVLPYNPGVFAQATYATVTLSQNRRTVQGTISAGGAQGQIFGNALQRGTLDEVTVNLSSDPLNSGGQNLNYNYSPFAQYCIGLYRGRLSSVSNGVRLSGILVSQTGLTSSMYYQWNTTYCPAITIDVARR